MGTFISMLINMKIIGLSELETCKDNHAEVRRPISAWISEVKAANWLYPSDVKDRYPSSSLLANDYIVFNIKGNKYRLLIKINYANQIVLIKKFGTHAEYSTWTLL